MFKQKQDGDQSNDFFYDPPLDNNDNESTPMLSNQNSSFDREGGDAAAKEAEEKKQEEEKNKEEPKVDPNKRPEPDQEKDFVSCLGCCDLQCHDPVSRDESCYCCCPLRAGMYIIGVVVIILFLSRFFTICFDFGNVYFDFWFNLINLLLVIPILVAVIFFINNWVEDSKESRQKLWVAMLMILGSLLMLCLWAIIYITAVYPYKYVYLGSGPEEKESIRGSKEYSNYMDEEKGGYILAECFWLIMEGALFTYFFFVCKQYEDTWLPKEPEEPSKEDEAKDKKD